MKNIKILVCCHKQSRLPSNSLFLPIHVGKALSEQDLGLQGDDDGENISNKNSSYCELTGMFWAWKNLKNVDYIGLCHYRRYFDFKGLCPPLLPCLQLNTTRFSEKIISPNTIEIEKLENGRIILPRETHYKLPVYASYCANHISDDFKVLAHVFESEPSNYREAFFRIMYNTNKVTHYNMFIMTWKDFDSYCSWLFSILKKVEERIDITHYNTVQKRVFGYMAERLMSVYVEANELKTIRKPVLWFCDGADEKVISFLKRLYRIVTFKMATYLIRDRRYK